MPLSISDMKTSVGELQRDYLFKMVVESYPVTVNVACPNAPSTSEAIDLYLAKGIFPNRKTNPIQLWWSGESYYFAGRDESTKNGDLTFRLDEGMRIKDFFEACKDLTGNLENHAAVNKPLATLQLGVYLIDVGKSVVTDYRRLVDVLVYSVDNVNLDKEGSGVVSFTVNISWDRSLPDKSKRGARI
jgi:hypothetical protein